MGGEGLGYSLDLRFGEARPSHSCGGAVCLAGWPQATDRYTRHIARGLTPVVLTPVEGLCALPGC